MEVLEAADDTPEQDRRAVTHTTIRKERRRAPPKHSLIQDGDVLRCLWCLKTASTADGFGGKCVHAAGHVLWKSAKITICSMCGCYSEKHTVMLQRPCRKVCKPQGRANLRRVFQEGKHPALDLDLPDPWLWRHCAPTQEQPHVEDISNNGNDCTLGTKSQPMQDLIQCLSTDHEHGRIYKSTDADDIKYKDAVSGDKPTSPNSSPGFLGS